MRGFRFWWSLKKWPRGFDAGVFGRRPKKCRPAADEAPRHTREKISGTQDVPVHQLLLPSQNCLLSSEAIFWSSSNEEAERKFPGPDAISNNSDLTAPLPTPTAYTVTPLFLIPCEAIVSGVNWPVFVWLPSVITTANYQNKVDEKFTWSKEKKINIEWSVIAISSNDKFRTVFLAGNWLRDLSQRFM